LVASCPYWWLPAPIGGFLHVSAPIGGFQPIGGFIKCRIAWALFYLQPIGGLLWWLLVENLA
jgi:hypothetical protein